MSTPALDPDRALLQIARNCPVRSKSCPEPPIHGFRLDPDNIYSSSGKGVGTDLEIRGRLAYWSLDET